MLRFDPRYFMGLVTAGVLVMSFERGFQAQEGCWSQTLREAE